MKNEIVHYFVIPSQEKGQAPTVIKSKVLMNADVALTVLNDQRKKQNKSIVRGKLLHVSYDVDSRRLYVPNSYDFSKEVLSYLLKAAKIKINNDYGTYSSEPPIEGSPLSSLRLRSVSSFPYTSKIITEKFKKEKFDDLPVVEANLARMPTTTNKLPQIFKDNVNYIGGYVGKENGDSIYFVDELKSDGSKRDNPILLLNQKTPFILINTSKDTKINQSEKEWVVVNGYREYLDKDALEDKKEALKDINKFADLYAVKRLLYLGWPLEEVCYYFFSHVSSFGEMIKTIQRLVMAVDSLTKEGYKNLFNYPFYATFKIDPKDFPIRLSSIINTNTGEIDPFKQFSYFRILDFDEATNYIIIESSVFIPPNICENVLKAKNSPFISVYNPVVNKIDIKSTDESFRDITRNKIQKAKIEGLTKYKVDKDKSSLADFRMTPESQGAWAVNPDVFHIRTITDYPHAYDFIKKMCEERKLEFKDLDVIVGPIEKLFGNGVQGGFMNREQFIASGKKLPFEIEKGVWVNPPVIFINSVTSPSYAEHTMVLIHEYSHNLFKIANPNQKKQYDSMSSPVGSDKYYEEWYNYLTDPDEIEAHKQDIKYQITTGKTIDEIVKEKMGPITSENLPVALKFEELVNDVIKEIKEEEKNIPKSV